VGSDPEQWYQAIKLLIENPQLRKSMSEAAYKEVVSCYGLDKAAARMDGFLSIYLRV
jgi:glycosyltransferase involved in cell wall biosynthesis